MSEEEEEEVVDSSHSEEEDEESDAAVAAVERLQQEATVAAAEQARVAAEQARVAAAAAAAVASDAAAGSKSKKKRKKKKQAAVAAAAPPPRPKKKKRRVRPATAAQLRASASTAAQAAAEAAAAAPPTPTAARAAAATGATAKTAPPDSSRAAVAAPPRAAASSAAAAPRVSRRRLEAAQAAVSGRSGGRGHRQGLAEDDQPQLRRRRRRRHRTRSLSPEHDISPSHNSDSRDRSCGSRDDRGRSFDSREDDIGRSGGSGEDRSDCSGRSCGSSDSRGRSRGSRGDRGRSRSHERMGDRMEHEEWEDRREEGSRSGGSAERSWWSAHQPRVSIGNMIFSTWYVQDDANPTHVLNKIANSPLHVIVVILEVAESAVADALMRCTHAGEGTEAVTDNHCVYFINRCVFVVTLKRQVTEFMVQRTSYFDTATFAIVHLRVKPLDTAVAVGIVESGHYLVNRLPPWLMSALHDAVYQHGVRLLTGTWGRTQEQLSELAQNLPLATSHPLAQAWKGDTPAVADVRTFPVYTLLLGKCSGFSMPRVEELLPYQTMMDNNWAPAVAGWNDCLPQWWPWTPRQIMWDAAGNMDWGHIKMKRVDPKRWIAGVYQVVFWCGVAQQGWGAKQTQKKKEEEKKEEAKKKREEKKKEDAWKKARTRGHRAALGAH